MLLQALHERPENRFPVRFPFLIGRMAQALAEGGRPREALGVLEETLATFARDPDHWCRPEILRARAQVRLQLGGAAARGAAASDFEAALAMSLAQGSRGAALRVATDLVGSPRPRKPVGPPGSGWGRWCATSTKASRPPTIVARSRCWPPRPEPS